MPSNVRGVEPPRARAAQSAPPGGSEQRPDASVGAHFRPLDGVRVVEFSSSIAGPLSTMILAQLGADVVKVESPEGDDARGWPPHVGDRSIVYRNMSVGKRNVVVDL